MTPTVRLIFRDVARVSAEWQRCYAPCSDDELKQAMLGLRSEAARGVSMRKRMGRSFGLAGECCRRKLGLTPFPVQYLAAASLVRGEIAQMNTGEGKTLTAVLAACLKAQEGRGVHVITVNEYLSRRDFEQTKVVYETLGLTVGLSLSGMSVPEKQRAYACDITCTTATEAGFDYLRDGVVSQPSHRTQRELSFAIVDEADSILLDEAVTPMILSGGGRGDKRDYIAANTFARYLRPKVFDSIDEDLELADLDAIDADYIVDRRMNSTVLTPAGVQKAERYYRVSNLFDAENLTIYHYILQALSAHGTLRRDVDYIIRNDKIELVDRNTGRVMDGRRYAAGLHQAVEAKEQLEIHQESLALATITYQKFFSLYHGLAGMTGTAWSARRELGETYKVQVRRIPPNRRCIRIDHADRVFASAQDKLNAVADAVQSAWRAKRPVLIGTPNDHVSEEVSALLTSRGVPHVVLGAKQDADEAAVVAGAGLEGSVVVATNMAGRGTDIRLGGGDAEAAERVRRLGGLLVLGVERQRSRRVDDQLIGRSGRQGDPGESQFFVCPEDEILRLFDPDNAKRCHVRRAQKAAELSDAGQRSSALEADTILQIHRRHFLKKRNALLETDAPLAFLHSMTEELVERLLDEHPEAEHRFAAYRVEFCRVFGNEALPVPTDEPIAEDYIAAADAVLARRSAETEGVFATLAQAVLLQTMDEGWSHFLEVFEELKSGYHFMTLDGSTPVHALLQASAEQLQGMNDEILREGLRRVFRCRLTAKTPPKEDTNDVDAL